MFDHTLANNKLTFLSPTGQFSHGLYLWHLRKDGVCRTIAVDAPRRVGSHLRLKSEHTLIVRDTRIIGNVIHHLRHQQVEGSKGYRESDEIKYRRSLEATCHVEHVSENVHILLSILFPTLHCP